MTVLCWALPPSFGVVRFTVRSRVGLCSDGGFGVGSVHWVRGTEVVVAWIECTGDVCVLHTGAWSRMA